MIAWIVNTAVIAVMILGFAAANPDAPREPGDFESGGDQHHYRLGFGELGGNPDAPCESGDCEPEGDQPAGRYYERS